MKGLRYGALAPIVIACLAVASTASAQQAQPKAAASKAADEYPAGSRKEPLTKQAVVSVAEPIQPTEVLKGDHIAAGAALRNRGGGVINLRGAPPDVTPVAAFLYWDILADDAEGRAIVSLNGAPVEGSLIGKGGSPCWAAKGNFAYRAKVPLYLLYAGINGDYKIAGIPSSENFGMDPWQSSPGPNLAEGATLVVFYLDESSSFKTTLVYEAPVSGEMFNASFAATLTGFTAPGGTAKLTLVGADGQIGGGLPAIFPLTAETSFFEGTQIAGPPGAGTPPSSLNVNSDWNGEDGHPLDQLWDTRTHIVAIKVGAQSAKVSYESQGDCLVVVAFMLGL